MKIVYSKQAAKDLSKISSPFKKNIKEAIEKHPSGDVKKLQGHAMLYRLRVGDWRIVFSYQCTDTVLIESIGPRGQIYKGV